MKTKFKTEFALVDCFVSNLVMTESDTVVREMPIRFGNIDVVNIRNTEVPFTNDQILVLSRPACSLVFTKVKNARPISKKRLNKTIGLSESTIANVLSELVKSRLIVKRGHNYFRDVNFVFPKTIITGYEAKLLDFHKAFYQAMYNKEYVNYSYLVFPLDVAKRLMEKHSELLSNNGIGLIGVCETKNVVLLKAHKLDEISSYIKLLSLAKAHTAELTI